jgi:phosphonate transport system substrate-binding protein
MSVRISRIVVVSLVLLTMLLSACQPAVVATTAPTAAQAEAATATKVPTQAPQATSTLAPTNAAPAAATATVAATEAPAATATIPPADCSALADMPTVAAGDLGSKEKPIVLTFVPSGDTGKITKAGTAIAECLSSMTGLNFTIEVGTSFGASIEAMGAEKAQVGFLNTFSVLLAQAKYDIVPVLAVLRKYNTNAVDPDSAEKGNLLPYYKGQFIARTADNIKSYADLKGKTFCFVDPNSTSGYIVPRIILKANGVDPDVDFKAIVNAGSHPNVAVGVYKGDCDAGVTFIDVLTDAAADLKSKYPDITDKVSAFAVTDRIPNDGVQFIKSLDPKLGAAIKAGLLKMVADPGGNATLRGLYSINGFAEIEPTFYSDFAAVLKAAGVDPAELVK